MNALRVLHPTRKILTGVAVAVVAATCMATASTTVSAASHHSSDVTQATKEWNGAPHVNVALAPKTKEW